MQGIWEESVRHSGIPVSNLNINPEFQELRPALAWHFPEDKRGHNNFPENKVHVQANGPFIFEMFQADSGCPIRTLTNRDGHREGS